MPFRSTFVAALALGAALSLAAPSSGSAQELALGTWTGTITPPDGGTAEVTYEVWVEEEALLMSIVPPAHFGADPFPTEGVQFEEGRLTFSWNAGHAFLDCELVEQEDGSLEGECVDGSGTSGFLTMVPPATDPD